MKCNILKIGIEKLPPAGQKKREALDKLMVVCPHCKCHEKRGLLEQHIVSACPTRLIFVIVCSWFSHTSKHNNSVVGQRDERKVGKRQI